MRYLSIILVLLNPLACQQKSIVSEQELKDYVLDLENGLRKQGEKNGVDLEVIYRPSALVIAQQLDGVSDKAERSKTISNFDSLSYFVIKLSRNGQEIENAYVGDPEKLVSVISYLSSTVAQNIYLMAGEKKTPALDAVYARMFGSSTATSIMAVFDTDLKQMNGKFTFCFDDTELNLGKNEFEFDSNDIKNTPTLNLN